MTQEHNSAIIQFRSHSLVKPMLAGAAMGLFLILIFILGADNPNPAWGRFWMIKPLMLTPFVGAMGGLFYYFMIHLRKIGLSKALAVIIGLVGFLFAQWAGLIIGLNGTMWN